ncbi:MAG: 50S ribosomal protein L33 [Candidatus Shikimatogenerans sp. JK-2022]|nr:50S ribosomal protein L33 [Candidatus Shikimatogenerans bostrichidophilus]
MSKNRKIIILECIESNKKTRYYTTKNYKKNKNKIILKKFNYRIKKQTLHKEI